jgi:hypothetical protein
MSMKAAGGAIMTERIAMLTPEQAERALLLFYDLLPREGWDGGNKPTQARMEDLADKLQENAPADIQSFLGSLRTGGDEAGTGEVTRMLLQQLAQMDSLRPYVEQAVARSEEPHMALDPFTLGACVIVLLAAMSSKTKISVKDGAMTFEHTGGAPKLVHELAGVVGKLPEVLKALPESAMKQIVGLFRPSTP